MSVTFTEREALRQLIEYIKDERARLWLEYTKAIGRLAELDSLDNVHPEIQVKTVVEPQIIEEPIQKSVIVEQPEIETQPENPEEKIDEYKDMTLAEAIEMYNKRRGIDPIEEAKQEPMSLFNASEIEATKDYDRRVNQVLKTPSKKSGYMDLKVVARDIVSILKEAGRPLRTKTIIEKLQERLGVQINSPYAMLNQARKHEPKIENVKFGFYQYKF